MVYPNGCCSYSAFFGFLECRQEHHPKCNIFGRNCVGCVYLYTSPKCDVVEVRCSCYYCCDPQYAATCPDGCKHCIKDGEGGCSQNSADHFKTLQIPISGNELSLSSLEPIEKVNAHFETIDVDKNGGISPEEAIAFLVKTKNGTSADDLAKNMAWFSHMDSNGNNRIEPAEFDRSLTE
ncbi:hypothetical protein niasHT_038433 [Heterodera trifolii]|uniref:EF-hand domain-containing protein n=1 Tax=Heterodera trifolii TaxID=157864 RepID=A0ABD2IR23_9BILA